MSENVSSSEPKKGEVCPQKRLNELSGKEWIKLSKSFWFQTGLGQDHTDAPSLSRISKN